LIGLFDIKQLYSSLVKGLTKDIKVMKAHVFKSNKCWEGLQARLDTLRPGYVLTEEDFQRNIEVMYREMPTSMGFTSNILTFMVYPTGLYFKREGSEILEKAAIVFVSDDKKHDHEQVQRMERRLMQLIKQKIFTPKGWSRWSDNCNGQYKSQFVLYDLINVVNAVSPTLIDVEFMYFEPNEGKNLSDTIGSLCKSAFLRAQQVNGEAVVTVDDMVSRMLEGMQVNPDGSYGSFSFLHIEAFESFDRIPVAERKSVYLKGIMNVRSLRRRHDGSVVALPLPCESCSLYVLCDSCAAAKGIWSTDVVVEEQRQGL
jgi:hypothetical protein